MPRRIGFLLSLLGFVSCIVLLITADERLGQPVFGNGAFPLGTLVAWGAYLSLSVGMYFSYPSILYPLSGFERFLKAGWLVMTLLSILWPAIAYGLSGNWAFTFASDAGFQGSNAAMWVFVYLSAGLAISLLFWPLLIVANVFVRGQNP